MPKRSYAASAASEDSTVNCSRKRTKLDKSDMEPLSTTSGNVKESNAGNEAGELFRDPKYYFEDGSVTFRVNRILFQVQASLLKAHSEGFFHKLALPSSDSSAPSGGTCDQDAIFIPDTQPSQFRNLLKIIYCLPSNNIVFTRPPPSQTAGQVTSDFDCYLDVAALSHKFDMEAVHQWAKEKLSQLVRNSGKVLIDGIDGDLYDDWITGTGDNNTFGNDHSRLWEEAGDLSPAGTYNAHRFMDAIKYARAVSDNGLLYDMLSILEYYSTCPGVPVEFLSSFFKIPDLCETDPSLFGFFFLLLLSHGNQVWITEKSFTQEDRVALFFAQSFLTPLPVSLKESILVPLFARPASADSFTAVFSAGTSKVECQKEIFDHWVGVFSNKYYDGIANKEFSASINALTTLPLRRINLSIRLRRVKCRPCRQRILEQFDQDMQEVFTRLGGYYKVYG